MADNLTTQSSTPATVPSSTVIATDDVAGVHYQRVKLVDGTLDGTSAIGGDATNGLDVDVTRVQGTVTVGDGGSTLSVDDGGGSLTVDGTVAVSGSVAVTGPLTDTQLRATAVPVSGTFYPATQPVSGTVSVDDGGGSITVDATSLPLPTGAATAAKQPALGVAGTASSDVITVQGIAGATAVKVDGSAVTQPVSDAGGSITVDDGGGSLTVDGTVEVTGTFWQSTQPVSAVSLPLPTGAATSANQSTANTSLSSIDGKVPVLGQALAAGSVPVVLTAAQVTALTPPTSVTADTELPAAAVLADGASNPSTPTAGSATLVYNGTTWDRARGDTTSGAWVNVKNGATTPIPTTMTPSASTGFVRGSASATGTADTSVIAAAGVGVKNYITSIHVANTGTSTSLITLKDGSGGSTLLTTVAPALGGSNITLPIPIATSANTALFFACGSSSTTIYITAVGYTGA